jgi:hypothetical protein
MKPAKTPEPSQGASIPLNLAAMNSREKDHLIKQLLLERESLIFGIGHAEEADRTPNSARQLATSLAAIVTSAWKARARMISAVDGEPHEETRRVFRHIESMFDAFDRLGLRAKDHTGDAFDYGMPLNVVTTQPTPGLAKERVIETIKPTIYWNQTIIQTADVVIATPVHP